MSRTLRTIVTTARSSLAGVALAACSGVEPASAYMTCDQAHRQVAVYMARVKAFADAEAYRNIPMRCGPDWRCGNWWIGRLNFWYGQQVQRARALHAEIERQCNAIVLQPAPAPAPVPQPLPQRQPLPRPSDPPPAAPGRTVAIEIPTTPEGYRP
ncbi:MAG: hypothetical protein KIT25_17070 [Enhydrobacter sp.]|nr:MAG: hypothetical protein KIT25_17070 [Enhydrobacter sp.]